MMQPSVTFSNGLTGLSAKAFSHPSETGSLDQDVRRGSATVEFGVALRCPAGTHQPYLALILFGERGLQRVASRLLFATYGSNHDC